MRLAADSMAPQATAVSAPRQRAERSLVVPMWSIAPTYDFAIAKPCTPVVTKDHGANRTTRRPSEASP